VRLGGVYLIGTSAFELDPDQDAHAVVSTPAELAAELVDLYGQPHPQRGRQLRVLEPSAGTGPVRDGDHTGAVGWAASGHRRLGDQRGARHPRPHRRDVVRRRRPRQPSQPLQCPVGAPRARTGGVEPVGGGHHLADTPLPLGGGQCLRTRAHQPDSCR
jgi:hypothetical protein